MAAVTILFRVALTLMTLFCHVTVALPAARSRRSDDADPLQAVVNGLSQQLTQLTAQLQARDALHDQQIAELKSRLDNNIETRVATLETPVAFTVRSSKADVTGLGTGTSAHIPCKLTPKHMDNHVRVLSFSNLRVRKWRLLQGMAHHSEQTSELQIYKGQSFLANVFNCCTGDAANSALATVHLNQGDTVHVQMARGSSFYGGPYTAFSGMKLSPK
ncbi:hypothetical protein BaRGS_00031825 [Batillaria attramentaria]|uniref:C1q domain-containing protein n=1 Tax=Batillaria attramentaria TaxID=370345 RepID=A0ABD0JQ12_9CAEN